MEELSKKVSYLRGLFDGLEISVDTKEGKMLSAIVNVLDEMSDEIRVLRDNQLELDDYITLVDDSLSQLEEEYYEYESEYDDEEVDFFAESDEEDLPFEKEVF